MTTIDTKAGRRGETRGVRRAGGRRHGRGYSGLLLHLYKAMAGAGPITSSTLAARTGTTERNPNPVGRTFYCFSTVVCTPASLAQEVGLGLGAQAGESRLADVLREAGFSHVRRATETPFNLVLKARP